MARPSPRPLGRYRGTYAAEHSVTGWQAGKTENSLMNASHADEHRLGAFHVAGKQEPREGNRVAF